MAVQEVHGFGGWVMVREGIVYWDGWAGPYNLLAGTAMAVPHLW